MSYVLPTLNSCLILIQTGSISSAEESTSCNSGLLEMLKNIQGKCGRGQICNAWWMIVAEQFQVSSSERLMGFQLQKYFIMLGEQSYV